MSENVSKVVSITKLLLIIIVNQLNNMKSFYLFMLLLISFVGCDEVSNINQNATTTKIDTIFEPPPPSMSVLNSTSLTLEQWFYKLCDTTLKNNNPILFQFGLFDTPNPNRYAVYLIDLEDYKRERWGQSPIIKYFLLDRVDYQGLNWRQVLSKIRKELLEMRSTEKFRTSNLAKAKSIIIRFDDLEILKLK